MRSTTGAHSFVGRMEEGETSRGIMLGYEQPQSNKVTFVKDWYSGYNVFGYAGAGLGVALPKDSYLFAGYSFGNRGRGNNDQTLINTARAFAQDAAPVADRFAGFGLPAEFLDNLETAIREFETAVERQNTGRDAHVSATTAIDEALERGINIVRQLDAIVRNRYAGDAPQLSAWQSASHIERSPQHATQTEAPPQG